MSERNPEARDRFRGMRLRAIRTERCGLTLTRGAEIVGQRTVTIQDFAMLLTAWELPSGERDQILDELAEGSTSGWWDRPIAGVPLDVGTLASYEAEANGLVTVATAVVPGLLQTRETAVAIMAADGVPPEDIDRRWMARLQRQQIITRIDYTVYIIPREQTHVPLLTTWHLMLFPHARPVVHVELGSGVTYIHEADWYTDQLKRLDRVAIPRDGTRKLIRELMEGE